MLGAIAGDIIGSVHEHAGTKTKSFPLFTPASTFTDDTVLTAAVADCLLRRGDYGEHLQAFFFLYPERAYSPMFRGWAQARATVPVNSFGNGSAMRVSPVAYAFGSLDAVLAQARRSAEVTHSHPEGVRGAQATAAAVFLARTGRSKADIRAYVERNFGYALGTSMDRIRPAYGFDATCQGSVPQSIIAFLESTDYEDAVRNAVSLGGDADTMACIAGSIAAPFYRGVPDEIRQHTLARLDESLRAVIEAFEARFPAS